jgi:glyceraldehyde 3-phosphate dehydrogenase
MTTRVLINGFGRIGRMLLRLLEARDDVQVTHINDPLPAGQLAYLLKYDSVAGRFGGTVDVKDGALVVNGRAISLSHNGRLDRDALSHADIVVNSSGRNNSRESLHGLLEQGARRVYVSKPLEPGVSDRTILYGINHHELQPEDRIISGGSCTAHCYTPLLALLHRRWPVVRGYMMTVHAYTSAQNLIDGGHDRDPRRGRSGATNIVPTTTESMTAFEQVLPELKGRITGMAQRVPVSNGSNVELVLELQGSVEAEELNAAVQDAARGEYEGIIEYSTDPLVSTDIVGNPHSAIFDSLLTSAQPGETTLARLLAWYDNEWGYANRLAELVSHNAGL